MKKGAAIFSILMGLAMFCTWLFVLLFAGFPQPELIHSRAIQAILQ